MLGRVVCLGGGGGRGEEEAQETTEKMLIETAGLEANIQVSSVLFNFLPDKKME